MRNICAPLLLWSVAMLGQVQPSAKIHTADTAVDSRQCSAPIYCADTSADVKAYSGSLTSPPSLNRSFTDPAFNRKIWRITDATTAGSTSPNASMGVPFQSFRYADMWNLNDTAMLAGQNTGGTSFLKANLKNPQAPSVVPWACTAGSLCSNGFIQAGSNFQTPAWSGTTNYRVFGINGTDTALYQADLDYNNNRNPVRSFIRLYSPYDSGQCLARRKGTSVSYTQISPDDQYSWGYASPSGSNYGILLHKSGHGCIYINLGVSPWTINGDSTIASTGKTTWTDDAGKSAPAPGAGCQVHGASYDYITNTVLFDMANINDAACFGAGPDDSPSVVVNLGTRSAAHITHPAGVGLGGHGMGIANVGGVVADIPYYFGPPAGFIWNPITISATSPRFSEPAYITVDTAIDQHGSNSDYISRRTTLPIIGANSWIVHNIVPPLSSYTVTRAYEGEITVTVIPSLRDKTGTTYRFVHNYSAAGSSAYGAQSFPAIAHDRCWIAFSSNWMGHLGDTRAKQGTKQCTLADNCRYDVFLTYICGPSGT